MSEFIDAEKLETYFKNITNEWGDGYKDIDLEELSESDKKIISFVADFMIRLIVVIDEFPRVEIIHCKECKYADEYSHCPYTEFYMTANDHCSKGKRKME